MTGLAQRIEEARAPPAPDPTLPVTEGAVGVKSFFFAEPKPQPTLENFPDENVPTFNQGPEAQDPGPVPVNEISPTPAANPPAAGAEESSPMDLAVAAPPSLEALRRVPARHRSRPVARVARSTRKARPLSRHAKTAPIRATPAVRNGSKTHTNGNGRARAAGDGEEKPEVALAFLRRLARRIRVGAVPLVLDYYRRLGWIPAEEYGWMCELASGVTKGTQPATWRMVKVEAAELAAVHRDSYRRLKELFRGAPHGPA